MSLAINVEHVGKRFQLGAARARYGSLRESLVEAARASLRQLRGGAAGGGRVDATIWAIEDVSFRIDAGEVVGIIGRNGAGKSTLLKMLSRITEPTRGRILLRGRVGSLLEVGTGFHPELTGRENIFLNGAILGMSKLEINHKFDEIVAFAEVERFIDTPVKRYSSGMYLRLAFAVAAHLEPEILLVDEVLAVGDVKFQKKCLNKMQDVGAQGRTVLFVSHSMSAITRLCERVILLHEGRVLEDGPATQVVNKYLGYGLDVTAVRAWPELTKAPGDEVARLRAVRVSSENESSPGAVDIRQSVLIEIDYDILQPGKRLSPVIVCTNDDGLCVFSSGGLSPAFINEQDPRLTGRRRATCVIPGNLLAEGSYALTVSLNAILDGNHPHAVERDAVRFQVVDAMDGDSARGLYGGTVLGVFRPLLQWTSTQLNEDAEAEESAALR